MITTYFTARSPFSMKRSSLQQAASGPLSNPQSKPQALNRAACISRRALKISASEASVSPFCQTEKPSTQPWNIWRKRLVAPRAVPAVPVGSAMAIIPANVDKKRKGRLMKVGWFTRNTDVRHHVDEEAGGFETS